jgi:hypothetical protein
VGVLGTVVCALAAWFAAGLVVSLIVGRILYLGGCADDDRTDTRPDREAKG